MRAPHRVQDRGEPLVGIADLAEDFQAIASPAVRQAVLHLLRQVCDPD